MTNTAFKSIAPLAFGYAFIGHHQTFKCRYKSAMAERIMQNLPMHFRMNMLSFTTQKGYTFLACIDHQRSAIWPALNSAITTAKAQGLRIQADVIEFGMPVEFELPF